ncbi:MAG: asparagine synthase (glutamine-hydrolyzing) [Bacteroidota bacterium]|nr:asparagine synthase (glutamine-hydrolyzing) [Bacteroidota bacterium]
MCGIVGGWWSSPPKNILNRLSLALKKLGNRGPDDQGYEHYPFNNGVIYLGHTRLSIIDLTSAGHQPMISKDGRFSIVFNGEIYNYRELRKELIELGHIFTSDSDTEVLLAAWQEWHIQCLRRFDGMFAFVVYDQAKKTLTCVRDAFGIKPFFYDYRRGQFLFASEQKALLSLREEKPMVNWQRSYDYLVQGEYDSNYETFIQGIQHLMPGHWLEVNLLTPGISEPQRWWAPSTQQTSSLSFEQAVEAVREKFLYNIRLHLRSDVPLGAALSGGIDSSAVVCAMRHVEPDLPIHTFSYIAPGFNLSEEKWVDQVNQFVGAISHKVTATAKDLENDIDSMIDAQGEPFGSTSIYAQYSLFQLVKERGVTVTLDGQGADELLAGYSGYPGQRLLSMLEQGKFLEAQKFALKWGRWPGRSYLQAWMYFGKASLPDGVYKAALKILGCSSPKWINTEMMGEAGVILSPLRSTKCKSAKGRRVIEQLGNALQTSGLPSLLRHGDRNSMQFSVESRVPFLTLPFAELLLSFPEDYLISKQGETKHVFRAAMRGIVPDNILDRKDKIGFATPEETWLIGISDRVRVWLQESENIPFLNRDELIKSFDNIVAGKKNRGLFAGNVWRWVNFIRWYQLLHAQ